MIKSKSLYTQNSKLTTQCPAKKKYQNQRNIKTHTTRYQKRVQPAKRDWRAYNQHLINSGRVELWIKADEWYSTERNGRRGRPLLYSRTAALAAHAIRQIYHQPYRQTQGLIDSLFILMGQPNHSMHYSHMSRLLDKLELPKVRLPQGKCKLMIDSTGIKVMGEGEWLRKKHGIQKSRSWVKLHLAVDYESGQILATHVTPNKGKGSGDASAYHELLTQFPKGLVISEILADGAYDTKRDYIAAEKLKAWLITPPGLSGQLGLHPERDRHVKTVRWHGEEEWKERVGYGRRALVETGMSRMKRKFGGSVASRGFNKQVKELELQCWLLNHLTHPELQIRNAIPVS